MATRPADAFHKEGRRWMFNDGEVSMLDSVADKLVPVLGLCFRGSTIIEGIVADTPGCLDQFLSIGRNGQ